MNTLREYLEDMDDPRSNTFVEIYDDLKDLFHEAKGSSYNHQAWKGGYADHIAETFRINEATYDALESIRRLPFTKDSAMICLFLHDIEKPFRYVNNASALKWRNILGLKNADELTYHEWEDAKWHIITYLKFQYRFLLSDEEINALKYTHGEGDDHQKERRVAGPLAAHVHHCDNASARIWFDEGKGLS